MPFAVSWTHDQAARGRARILCVTPRTGERQTTTTASKQFVPHRRSGAGLHRGQLCGKRESTMPSFRPRTFTEYLQLIWQRRLLFFLVTLAMLLATFVIVRRIPDQYQSKA